MDAVEKERLANEEAETSALRMDIQTLLSSSNVEDQWATRTNAEYQALLRSRLTMHSFVESRLQVFALGEQLASLRQHAKNSRAASTKLEETNPKDDKTSSTWQPRPFVLSSGSCFVPQPSLVATYHHEGRLSDNALRILRNGISVVVSDRTCMLPGLNTITQSTSEVFCVMSLVDEYTDSVASEGLRTPRVGRFPNHLKLVSAGEKKDGRKQKVDIIPLTDHQTLFAAPKLLSEVNVLAKRSGEGGEPADIVLALGDSTSPLHYMLTIGMFNHRAQQIFSLRVRFFTAEEMEATVFALRKRQSQRPSLAPSPQQTVGGDAPDIPSSRPSSHLRPSAAVPQTRPSKAQTAASFSFTPQRKYPPALPATPPPTTRSKLSHKQAVVPSCRPPRKEWVNDEDAPATPSTRHRSTSAPKSLPRRNSTPQKQSELDESTAEAPLSPLSRPRPAPPHGSPKPRAPTVSPPDVFLPLHTSFKWAPGCPQLPADVVTSTSQCIIHNHAGECEYDSANSPTGSKMDTVLIGNVRTLYNPASLDVFCLASAWTDIILATSPAAATNGVRLHYPPIPAHLCVV